MAKFKKVIIHVGADKTGSSSIQQTLDSACRHLLDKGLIAYPPGVWHAQLGSLFCDCPELYIFNTTRGQLDRAFLRQSDEQYMTFLKGWIDDAPPCDALIFSYEGFIDLNAVALRRLRAFCLTLAPEVLVVMYVRPPLSYALSNMSQRARMGIRLSLDYNLPVSPYKTFLERLTGAFGKEEICIRPFAREMLVNGNVVADFLSILGVSMDAVGEILDSTKQHNSQLSWPAIRVAETVMDVLAERRNSLTLSTFFQKIGTYLGAIPGAHFRIPIEQAEIILAAAQPHSDYLAEEFAIVFDEALEKFTYAPDEDALPEAELLRSFGIMLADSVCGDYQPDVIEPELLILKAGLAGASVLNRGELLIFDLEFSLDMDSEELDVGIQILDEFGRVAFGSNSNLLNRKLYNLSRGIYHLRFTLVADFPFGPYSAGFSFYDRSGGGRRKLGWYSRAVTFQVNIPNIVEGEGYTRVYTEVECRKTEEAALYLFDDGRGTIECDAVFDQLEVNETRSLRVTLTNQSGQTWVSTPFHALNLSYHWFHMDGTPAQFEGHRTPLPTNRLLPGQTVCADLHLAAPALPGRYRLALVPVHEGRFWLDGTGFEMWEREVTVVLKGTGLRYPGSDFRLSTCVGIRDNQAMSGSGQAGFLLFGPYAHLPPGSYTARFEGVAHDILGGWADVCIRSGTAVLARQDLSQGECIAILSFVLEEAATDVEVRLWVPAGADIRVEALAIEAADQDSPTFSK